MRRKAGDWRRKKVEGRQEREDRRGKTGEGIQEKGDKETGEGRTGEGRQETVDSGRWTVLDGRR